ncbi:MAG TPA: OsmC family protein [Thermoanaerobaculia bacterium]|nr:OsmC family protein [Thermoanaerobaculia bacterium]
MPVRKADAVWEGSLREGRGRVRTGSGGCEGAYSFGTRFEEEPGTNPEELIGAAHAGCFSMALSAGLGKAGFSPQRIETKADVHLEKQDAGFSITRIHLTTTGQVPDIDETTFKQHAEDAKKNCPVSRALGAIEITLDARLG